MSPSRPPTVYVPARDRTPVFHTSTDCRHCPPSAQATPRPTATDAGLLECEVCYEERVDDVGVPFTLVASPRAPMPASLSWHAEAPEK